MRPVPRRLAPLLLLAVGGAVASFAVTDAARYDYDALPRVVAATHNVAPVERTTTTPNFNLRSYTLGGGSAPQASPGAIRFDAERFLAAKAGASSLDDLARAAQASERDGQTAAGRALQKHGDRAGSIYPKIGSPAERSRVAQEIVEDYLTNPLTRERVRRDGVRIFEMPDGRGVSFNMDGSFRGLLEPYR